MGLSDAEVAEVLADDKRIDRDEELFELNAEQKKASKQARQADRTPTTYKFTKRKHKPNEDKRFLMELLEKVISPECDCMEIINPEREFSFFWNGTKYKVVLSAPRK